MKKVESNNDNIIIIIIIILIIIILILMDEFGHSGLHVFYTVESPGCAGVISGSFNSLAGGGEGAGVATFALRGRQQQEQQQQQHRLKKLRIRVAIESWRGSVMRFAAATDTASAVLAPS